LSFRPCSICDQRFPGKPATLYTDMERMILDLGRDLCELDGPSDSPEAAEYVSTFLGNTSLDRDDLDAAASGDVAALLRIREALRLPVFR
jgi:hypothetical protein